MDYGIVTLRTGGRWYWKLDGWRQSLGPFPSEDAAYDAAMQSLLQTCDEFGWPLRSVTHARAAQPSAMTDIIEVKLTETYRNCYPCTVCGGRTENVSTLAENKNLGIIVCERCLQAGDIDARIKWNIDGLTRYAAKLQTLVGRLKVPTFAEWEAAEQAIGLRENPNEPIPEGIQGSHDSLVPF